MYKKLCCTVSLSYSVADNSIMTRFAYFIYLFVLRLVIYFVILAFLLAITVIALKYLGEWREQHIHLEDEGETSPLMPQQDYNNPAKILTTTTTYGACQNDIESANCSGNNSDDDIKYYCSDLYDAKLCIICYDQQRNCFLVPCGHCATCFSCAQRIYYEENKRCPVCRRFIGKIRRLFDS